MRYANGVTNVCQYDSLNRLTNAVWKLNASPLASFYYQLGLTGHRTNLSESVNGTGRTYAWQYDALYRMTNENIGAIGQVSYAYDAVGNRTNRNSTISQLPTVPSNYNTNDWLQSDAYDSDGNTIWSTNGSVKGPYYYDVENRLTNYNNSVYLVYNGDGTRVQKTVGSTTTYYLVDDRNPSGYAQVLEEWTAGSGVTNLGCVYNYGLNLISQRVPNSSTNYFVFDGHGSTRMLTDAGGTVINVFAYDAFGTLIASNTTPQTVYLYCGQQFDPELGLYYNRARYLNTDTGRFWTSDTYTGNNEDPLSLHKYLYANADPVDGIDPSGKAVYFVTRHFNSSKAELYLLNAGHGFLLFTDTSDSGYNDPYWTHQKIVDTYSWHPSSWTYATSDPGLPGRVWEMHPVDTDPGILSSTYLVTSDSGDQLKLQNYISSWIAQAGCGRDWGSPIDDPHMPGNEIGNPHVDAKSDGVYYTLYGQNCVWWCTIMLRQSGIKVRPDVYDKIRDFNWGKGYASQVVSGARSAAQEGRAIPPQVMDLIQDYPVGL